MKYESVRRSQLKQKGLKPQRGVSYLPEKDTKVNRWHEKRLNARHKKPRTPGVIRIRTGSAMMVAGRAVPILVVGYLAYDMLPDRESSARDTHEGKIAGGVKDNVDLYVDTAADVYTGLTLGYSLGKGLLGVFA